MGPIDQLNFKVILDDAEFNSKVRADIQLASDLNVNMSTALNIAATRTAINIDGQQATATVNNLAGLINQLITSLSQANVVNVDATRANTDVQALKDKLDAILRTMGNINNKPINPRVNLQNTNALNNSLTNQSTLLRSLSSLAGRYFSVMGATRFLSKLVEITGEFEVQQMALRTILNDVSKADEIFDKLRQFAIESPYTFQELTKYTKQLAAFDIPADKLLETNKMLADVAAGLGVSMDRLILAYGHVKSSGFLRGMQLRQFTQNGVPILEQLSDILTEVEGKAVSVGQVFEKMTKRQIDFSMVEEAFRRMTSEGGKFYQMQEVLVDTLQGKIGKLKDTFQQALYNLGSDSNSSLKDTVDFLTSVVSHLDTIAKFIIPVVSGLGAYATSMALVTIATKAQMGLKYAHYLITLATNMKRAAAVNRMFGTVAKSTAANISAMMGAITLLITGVIEIGKAIERNIELHNQYNNTVRSYSSTLMSEQNAAKSYIARLNELTIGTKEYENVKDKFLSKYGQYLSAIDKENLRLGKTDGLYKSIAKSIEEKMKQQFLDQGMQDVTDAFTKQMNKWKTDFQAFTTDLADSEIDAIMKYVRGEKVYDELSSELRAKLASKKNLGGIYSTLYDPEVLRARYRKITDDAEKQQQQLVSFFTAITKASDNSSVELANWQKKVQAVIDKMDPETAKRAGINLTKDDNDYYDYIDRVGKQWKELQEQRDKALKVDKKDFDAWIEAIELVNKALEGNILLDERLHKTPWLGSDSKETQALTQKINTLNKLRREYEKLTEFVSGERAKAIMKANANGDQTLIDFIDKDAFQASKIAQLIDEVRTKLGSEKADSLLAALGKDYIDDLVKDWQKLSNTTKSYFDTIRSWDTEDTDTEGKGFFYKMSKVASDLETRINKLTLNAQKAKEKLAQLATADEDARSAAIKGLIENGVPEDEANEFWEKWVTGGTDAIEKLVKASIEKATDAAREKVTGLAKTYLEEEFFLNGIDLTELGDKTMKQLRDLKQRLYDELAKLKISDSQVSILKGLGIDIDNLKDVDLSNLAKDGGGLSEATIKTLELRKAVQKANGDWEEFVKIVEGKVGKSLEDVNEKGLKKTASLINTSFSAIKTMTDSWKEYANVIGDPELENNIAAIEQTFDLFSQVLQNLSNGDWIGAIVNSLTYTVKLFADAAIESAKFQAAIESATRAAERANFTENLSRGVESVFGTNSIRKINNAIIELKKLRTNIYENAGNREFKWNNLWGKNIWTLQGMADKLGYELYDSYGNLNAVALKAILDTYTKLNKADKDWIEEATAYSEKYTEAMKNVEDVTKTIFGYVVDSITDQIVDGWANAGNAALDYTDILDEVARSYAKLLVKNALMDSFFNDKKAAEVVKLMFNGKQDEAMELLAAAMQGVQDALPMLDNLLDSLKPYIKPGTNAEGSSLGESIRDSINEEQANLIASYVNAMRADLSFMRGKQTQYIDYMFSAIPTLADHVASIDARAYDIAQTNASIAESSMNILTELRSVIGISGSGFTAVKVETV